MSISLTAVLGLVFLGLAIASTYLMFAFWGHPYDKDRRKSACPQWKMNIHRAVGYAYAIIYVVMMWHMVPRLWQYQIEFPPRTVAHIMLGITIGVILLLKVSILRWFRHFEEWMPVLGVAMLLCTFLLVGLSLPFVLKESRLAASGVGGSAFSSENRARVAELMATAGLPEGTDLGSLSSERSLHAGRRVLLDKCTYCHDLKTAIARPRTPEDWVQTVERMREKPTLGASIDAREAAAVAAYLVAITPELQQSVKKKRASEEERAVAMAALQEMEAPDAGTPSGAGAPGGPAPGAAVEPDATVEPDAAAKPVATTQGKPAEPAKPRPTRPKVDLAHAKLVFHQVCSRCHPADDVQDAPPRSRKAVNALIARMIENGLDADKTQLELVRQYLLATYAGR